MLHGTVGVCLCVHVLVFLCIREKMNLLAAARAERIDVCLGLGVYTAKCHMACYCSQRGFFSVGLILLNVEHTHL